jgi:hypothetical protein
MNPVEFLIYCAAFDFFSRGPLRAHNQAVVFAAAAVLESGTPKTGDYVSNNCTSGFAQ